MCEISDYLASVVAEIKAGRVYTAIRYLHSFLLECKTEASGEEWQAIVQECRCHELRSFVHRCPISYRSYYKPRGYQGDAQLLDLIYTQKIPEDTDEIGEEACKANLATPAAKGVQNRRLIIAKLVGEVTNAVKQPRILSVAAGHLREIELCASTQLEKIEEWVALDQDELSLAEIRRCYPYSNVRPCSSTLKPLLLGTHDLGTFDLVYAAGLYDYLQLPVAQQLSQQLFHTLRPGGRLLVANYLPELPNRGYMEAYMDWNLTYRGLSELEQFVEGVNGEDTHSLRTFAGEEGAIGYLEVTRN